MPLSSVAFCLWSFMTHFRRKLVAGQAVYAILRAVISIDGCS
jgi:hypothetical protein